MSQKRLSSVREVLKKNQKSKGEDFKNPTMEKVRPEHESAGSTMEKPQEEEEEAESYGCEFLQQCTAFSEMQMEELAVWKSSQPCAGAFIRKGFMGGPLSADRIKAKPHAEYLVLLGTLKNGNNLYMRAAVESIRESASITKPVCNGESTGAVVFKCDSDR